MPPPVAPRLPPLTRVRVRRANKPEPNPCTRIMSSMLGCWASSGQAAAGCMELEQALKSCMDEQVSRTFFKILGFFFGKTGGRGRWGGNMIFRNTKTNQADVWCFEIFFSKFQKIYRNLKSRKRTRSIIICRGYILRFPVRERGREENEERINRP